MKARKISILLASLVLGATLMARACLYDITFNDGRGDIGSGEINVQTANGNCYCTACSGYLNVTSGEATGCWNLFSSGGATSYPGYLLSPAGAYWYNNTVYQSGSNPQYGNRGPLLDVYGLLFTQNGGNELNLWGNADGTYTLAGNIGGWQNFNVNISFGGTSITPVPEPSTILACGFLLVPIGASAYRSLRKKTLQADA